MATHGTNIARGYLLIVYSEVSSRDYVLKQALCIYKLVYEPPQNNENFPLVALNKGPKDYS